MKVACWNVNGIRAVEKKGDLETFLKSYDPDVFFIQEIKGTKDKFSSFLTDNKIYLQQYHSAEKPGYSGTGVWIKKSLNLNPSFFSKIDLIDDNEGRTIGVEFNLNDKKFCLIGVYFPNGGKSEEAWNNKLIFYSNFLTFINEKRKNGFEVIWCGDVNAAHNEIDLARPAENIETIGFLPQERKWVSKVIEENWVDVYRKTNPDKVIYSWWNAQTRSRLTNVGWRIDYFFCDINFFSKINKIDYLNNQMGSDHCPIILEF